MERISQLSRRDFLKLSGVGATTTLLTNVVRSAEHEKGWPPEVISKFETDEPYFALTIDDGWHAETLQQMLDVMRDEGMQSTFFLVGEAAQIAEYKIRGILKRIVDEGHTIGYHSMDHGKNKDLDELSSMPTSWWSKDYEEWLYTMETLVGKENFSEGIRNYARAPYGLFTNSFLRMCRSKGLKSYGWLDNPYKAGKGDIVLLHVNQQGLNYLKNIKAYANGALYPTTIDCLEEEGTCPVLLNEQKNVSSYSEGETREYYWTQHVPPSLMLHSKDYKLLRELIPHLKTNFAPMTYKSWYEIYQQKKQILDSVTTPYYYNPASKRLIKRSLLLKTSLPPLIISIDDVGTSWIRREHLEMFQDLQKADIPAVVGVQPQTNPEEGGRYWEKLRQLHDSGWEIASHTIRHTYLAELSDKQLKWELFESARRIEEGIGEAPITLIVPFGDIWPGDQFKKTDERIFEMSDEAGYKFVIGVGSGQGKEINKEPPFYFGRVIPDISASVTLQRLRRFNS